MEGAPFECAHDGKKKKFCINYDYCKGCGVCAYECPVDAIEMVVEEK
jgi:pyruvate ferredoxin oxidoreductase delta subunit